MEDVTARPRLSAVGPADPPPPCFACAAEPGTRCGGAWHVYGIDTTWCPIRSGKAAITAAQVKRISDAVATGRPGIRRPAGEREPLEAWPA
jgi:hypothetical protein